MKSKDRKQKKKREWLKDVLKKKLKNWPQPRQGPTTQSKTIA